MTHVQGDFPKDLAVEVGIDWGLTKQENRNLKRVIDRRDDFINWLVEVKLADEQLYLSELWDEFEKYEQQTN